MLAENWIARKDHSGDYLVVNRWTKELHGTGLTREEAEEAAKYLNTQMSRPPVKPKKKPTRRYYA